MTSRWLLWLVITLPVSQSGFSNSLHCHVNGAVGWYPIVYRQGEQLRGVAVDVLRRFESTHRATMDFDEELPWVRVENKLKNGQLDIIAGAYYNETRAAEFVYSEPFTKEHIHLFVNAENRFAFSKLSQLEGRRGLRPAGGSYGQYFDEYADKHLDIQEITNIDTMFRMLLGQRADFIVLAKPHGLQEVKERGLSLRVDMLSTPVAENHVYFMFNRHSPCLKILPALNAFLANP